MGAARYAVLEGCIKEGDTFLDIGANVGYFTLLASRLVGLRGRVLAFEPNPQVFQLLAAGVLENCARNVTLYPFAASDSEGLLKLVAGEANSLVINTDHPGQGGIFWPQPYPWTACLTVAG